MRHSSPHALPLSLRSATNHMHVHHGLKRGPLNELEDDPATAFRTLDTLHGWDHQLRLWRSGLRVLGGRPADHREEVRMDHDDWDLLETALRYNQELTATEVLARLRSQMQVLENERDRYRRLYQEALRARREEAEPA